ncbi:MAG: DUF2092 domain-containing protein [Planctomycetaceae bacterium]|nr:DUF2092 domain-containing protein [Planctomycetaceae bacterium]
MIRGPAGGAVGGVRGPGGAAGAVARLPDGAASVRWHGNDYWHNQGHWYSPYWNGDSIWYRPIYPPVGWFTPSLNWGQVNTVVIDNTTYYESQGVYYQKSTQDGQEGYAVAPEPAQATVQTNESENLPNPFDVLKNGLGYLARQPQFTMTVSDVYDEVTEDGKKVSFTSSRDVYVRRPSNLAVEYRGDNESRRVVLDGKNVTLLDRTKNSYGQAPMAGTIDAALDTLATQYGMVVAAGELMRTNLYDRVSAKMQTGQYLGQDTIGVYACDHVGFTTPDTDLEAWFQTGDRPLLRKFSIAYKNMPARPRYSMMITRFETSPVADYQLKAEIPPGTQQVSLTPPAGGGSSPTPSAKPQ